jgi:branched-chain amino acid transport system substrate-binding protein
MKTTLTTTALSGLLAFGLAGAAIAEIRIGSTLSETGPASFLGDPEAKTLHMLVDEINAAGGVNGEQIRLIMYDDGGDPNRARTFATRLVEDDEVVAIIGGTTTGTSMSIIPVIEEAEIPFISLAGAIEIIDPVQPFTFKTPHTDRMACAKIFEDMQERGITRIGMISGTDGFGASMRNQCLSIAGDYGIEIVADESYGPQDADMTPQLTNIRGRSGIEAVLNPGFGQGPSIVTRNYAQLGIELPLYQSHGVASQGFIDLAGPEAAEGVRLPGTALLVGDLLAEDDPQLPVVRAYTEAYEATYGTPVTTFGGYAHDAFRILVDAIERAGSTESQAIRDAIEATEGLVGTTGIYTMSAEDHLGLDISAFRMLEIRDGGWALID